MLHDEWIAGIVQSGAWRSKARSLPMLWLLIASAFVFPMGLWNSMDVAGQADEIQNANDNTSSSADQSTAVSATVVSPNDGSQTDGRSTTHITLDVPRLPEAPIYRNRVSVPATDIAGMQRMKVTVIVSGQTRVGEVPLRHGSKVRDAVAAMNLKLYPHDRVIPAADSVVYHNLKIRITRIRSVIRTRSVSIQPDVRYQPTSGLRPGASQTIQSGRSGKIQISQRIWFKDGIVSGRENLAEKTVSAARDEIIAVGARARYLPGRIPYHKRYATAYVNASRAGSPRDRIQSHQTKTLRRVRSITLTATGYSPDPGENGGWTTTATGLPIGYGAAAVDPRVIPLGTKMYVEGYGYAFACDTGGAIKGRRIDLAYDSYGLANSKGHKKVRVWILAP